MNFILYFMKDYYLQKIYKEKITKEEVAHLYSTSVENIEKGILEN